MPPAQDPDVTQSADEDDTSDPYIDVQINEDEDIDNALKSWDILVNPIYESGLNNAASDAFFSSAEPRIRDCPSPPPAMSWREFYQRITKTNRQLFGNMYNSIKISRLAGLYRMSEGQGREVGRMMMGVKKKMMVEMIRR